MGLPWLFSWKLVGATLLSSIMAGTGGIPLVGPQPGTAPSATPTSTAPANPGNSSSNPTNSPTPTTTATPSPRATTPGKKPASTPTVRKKPVTPATPAPHRSGEVITALRDGANRDAVLRRASQRAGVPQPTVVRQLATGSWLVRVAGPAKDFQAALLAQPEVLRASLNERVTRTATDPYRAQQWNLKASAGVGAESVWTRTVGSNVRIAVLDTGKTAHPDLAGAWLGGYDFVTLSESGGDGNGRDPDATDTGDFCNEPGYEESASWHGTHVAGIIAARQNSIGITGVAPGSRIVPIRVLGRCGGYSADVLDAMVWAAGGKVPGMSVNPYPARIVNMSLTLMQSSSCNQEFTIAVDMVRRQGALPVMAAGNEAGPASDYTPGNCRGALTVAASTNQSSRSSYSNYGGPVKLAAPGGDYGTGILSTVINSQLTNNGLYDYAEQSGTSMAAPHVAATAALALHLNPQLSVTELEALLIKTVRPASTCSECGAGILNAAAVVAALPTLTTVSLNPPAADAAADAPRTLTLRGGGFTGATQVWVGSQQATFTRTNDSTLVVTVPAGLSGTMAVWVKSPLARSTSRLVTI